MAESAVTVAAETAAEDVSFGRQLTLRALSDPNGVALTVVRRDGSEISLTSAALEHGANQWGRALARSSATAGGRIVLALPNSVEIVLATLACWKVGAVPIPMRWDLPHWERERLLEVIEPTLVIDEVNCAAYAQAAAHQSHDPLSDVVSPAINGICSSGSTGLPKIILTDQPALFTARHKEPFITHWVQVPRPQTILVPGPMYHTNGFNALNYLLGGDRLVILEKFDASVVLDTIEKHRISTFTATPTMLSRIADIPEVDQRDLSSIQWILQGAAVMPETLLRRWFELLSPEKIVMAYGMTENLGLTALRGDEWLDHPGSVGRGFRDTEIRILDDRGKPVPTGDLGEVFMRAPMTDGYRYLGGAAPLPTTTEGFTSAGDMGYLDADGYLYVIDRRTDMIVTGGANVFPAEVESALIDHESIADVVVIGLSDPKWGRRVHAVVQPTDTADSPSEQAVIEYAKRKLAGYKVPKSVEFVDQIPRTAATKVNRSAMARARCG